MERNAESERLKELMIENLRIGFPLFNDSHRVDAFKLEEEKFWIGYRTNSDNVPIDTTHFDLNIWGDVCYALYRELEKSRRGHGLGWALYESVHRFARKAGCRVVRCTPSGGVFIDGKMTESRRDYLLRRGYTTFGEHEVELVL